MACAFSRGSYLVLEDGKSALPILCNTMVVLIPVYSFYHSAAFTNKVLFEETDISLTLQALIQACCIQRRMVF